MFRTALSFDDVLLVPSMGLDSRSLVSLTTRIPATKLTLPILSANMKTVTETDMATEMANAGGLGVIHRMQSIESQQIMVSAAVGIDSLVGFAFGIGDDWRDRVYACFDVGATLAVLDVAHAHQYRVGEIVKLWYEDTALRDRGLLVGNIATVEAAEWLIKCIPSEYLYSNLFGLKVGIGGGSLCTTRIVTGAGIPTFQSVYDVNKAIPMGISIVADGGIRNSGDIIKSLAAGASAVMCGSLLAGTKQAPGNVVLDGRGNKYKVYRGSASYGDKKENNRVTNYVEGTETLVPYVGDVRDVLEGLAEGIRSGLSYVGASSISALHRIASWKNQSYESSMFVQVTDNGRKESQAHGLTNSFA